MQNINIQKIGLITGCGKGIGLSITKKLLKNDANIIIGISRSSNKEMELLVKNNKKRFFFHELNISDNKAVTNLIKNVLIKYGSINFAICNAGVRSRLAIENCDLNVYREIFENNTISNINITKAIIENTKNNNDNKCKILLISSIVGSRGFDELSSYAVSKTALEGFMKSAAVEYAKKNIQVNCLAPGFVESSYADNFKKNKNDLYNWTLSQIPMGRWGQCEEIAELAIFMISDKNSYMTGTVVYCDGGWTAK